MVKALLAQLHHTGRIKALDLAFGEFIAEQESSQSPEQQTNIALLAACLSARLGDQDSCLHLADLAQPFGDVHQFPPMDSLLQQLSQGHSVLQVRDVNEGADKPLVLDGGKLYLQRYWQYERELAGHILHKAANSMAIDIPMAKMVLDQLFTERLPNPAEQPDWQKIAVAMAATQQFSVITGGPGTGKTTTVTRLMALLHRLSVLKAKPLIIKLVAPTGKAAARLSQSISQAKTQLPEALQHGLPEQCTTVHRLLGALPHSPYFKHNSQKPLHLDVLVLDEASMVDLPLMSKLFGALPARAQIILLGDKDQLASVEAGSVLSDICAAALGLTKREHSPVAYSPKMVAHIEQLTAYALPAVKHQNKSVSDNVLVLQKSHRFSAKSGIGRLASSINRGQYQQSLALLNAADTTDIHWHEQSQLSADKQNKQLVAQLMPAYSQYFAAIKEGDIQAAFRCLGQQQVLCAQKSGEWGVHQLNALIEKELHKQGLIDTSRDFYLGRPLMLGQNDHHQQLFNGDIGIVMPDPGQPEVIKVWFITAQGQIRALLPSRLPLHQTLYAMTIHKSQGSEFEHVYLCLPNIKHGAGAKGLSRELLYTGLTRAKNSFSLYASQQALQLSLQQQCKRGSGLAERLICGTVTKSS
ncbi:MAG: exodeoxyribonuclease V alpha subunit [Paraglaciecola sp.]|jgi:exodeoxyribonuclease V alpha subunit